MAGATWLPISRRLRALRLSWLPVRIEPFAPVAGLPDEAANDSKASRPELTTLEIPMAKGGR